MRYVEYVNRVGKEKRCPAIYARYDSLFPPGEFFMESFRANSSKMMRYAPFVEIWTVRESVNRI